MTTAIMFSARWSTPNTIPRVLRLHEAAFSSLKLKGGGIMMAKLSESQEHKGADQCRRADSYGFAMKTRNNTSNKDMRTSAVRSSCVKFDSILVRSVLTCNALVPLVEQII